jgi:uncharacterized protein YutE (UPF0331/DUF86 family)
MRLDLYQAETARIASEQSALLENARAILTQGRPLTPLELSGVLHALQVLVENAIGKAKQLLKARNLNVPISGYDAFSALNSAGLVQAKDLVQWNAAVGLRNRIVHDYMNIETPQIINLVSLHKDQFIVDFLLQEFKES